MIAALALALLPVAAPSVVPPISDPLPQLAEAMTTATRAHLEALFAPGSIAYTYFEGLVLFDEYPSPDPFLPCAFTVQGEQLVPESSDCGSTISNIVVDGSGLVTDWSRDGRPLSQILHPIGVVTELAPGVTVTVHSVRHFEGTTQLVMVVANGGADEVYAWCQTFVTEAGRQHEATYSPPSTFPGATIADINVWEVTDEGGQAYCNAGSIGGDAFAEWTISIPPVDAPSVSVPPPVTT